MIHIFFVFNYLNDLCDSTLQTDKKNNNASICVLLNDNQEKEKITRKKRKRKKSPRHIVLLFFSISISSTQIIIPGWTAVGVRALWVSEHPLRRTRYLCVCPLPFSIHVLKIVKTVCPSPHTTNQKIHLDEFKCFIEWNCGRSYSWESVQQGGCPCIDPAKPIPGRFSENN